jgi:hypothetical protein
MAEKLIKAETLQAIADAIKAKEETTDLIPVDEYASRIGALNVGNVRLQEKTVTPTAERNIMLPDEGYDGFSSFTVEGDANLKSENIAKGVSIFGVKGTHAGGGSTGGGSADDIVINNQDLTITENGTYTADEGYTGLGTVTVDVKSGGDGVNLDAIWEVDGTTPTEVHSNATSVRPYVFQECPAITVADFPKATSMGEKAFYKSGVTVANFPELLIVPKQAFNNCRNLKSANFQKAETLESRP